jgi:hypothetical protein
MPIPDFDHNLVLPPHVGDHAASRANMSPYPCTSLELCAKLGGTVERQRILRGFFELRDVLRSFGLLGFQWLDGSFTEDKENSSDPKRKGPPGDIDVVTFYRPPTALPSPMPANLAALLPVIQDRDATKKRFHVDHILVRLDLTPEILVDDTRYWFGLFSHRRGDDVWKGMLQMPLETATDDTLAIGTLNGGNP